MLEVLTTVAEIAGAFLICTGIALSVGMGLALIAAGCFFILGSYLVTR
jgi:drug/metabolite transporter superfamily protein YnfA